MAEVAWRFIAKTVVIMPVSLLCVAAEMAVPVDVGWVVSKSHPYRFPAGRGRFVGPLTAKAC